MVVGLSFLTLSRDCLFGIRFVLIDNDVVFRIFFGGKSGLGMDLNEAFRLLGDGTTGDGTSPGGPGDGTTPDSTPGGGTAPDPTAPSTPGAGGPSRPGIGVRAPRLGITGTFLPPLLRPSAFA